MSTKNKYYRYLNLPFEIEPPEGLIGYELDPPAIAIQGCYHQKLYDFCQNFGLYVQEYSLFYIEPNGGSLHVHSDLHDISDDLGKINVSWGGGPNSRTEWFENQGGPDNLERRGDPSSNMEDDIIKQFL